MSSPNEAASAPSTGKPKRKRLRRSRTFGFVAGFFVITFALLLGYRAIVDTTVMSRYLYYVAIHTSWVLDKIGYQSAVEGEFNAQGREAAMRAELAAWQAGEEPPKILPESGPDEPPLSRWEKFQHRLYSNSVQVEKDKARLAELNALPSPERGSPEDVIAFLQQRIDRLEELYTEPMYREGEDGEIITSARYWGDPEAQRKLSDAQRRLDSLPADDAAPEAVAQNVNAAAQLIAESQQVQSAYLNLSISRRSELGLGTGPLIHYTHSASPQTKLSRLQRQRLDIQNNERLSESERESRLAEIDERIAAAEEARAKAAEEGTEPEPDRAFPFRVIAECGAIQSMSIFVAAVLAFPTRIRKRVAGILIGIPILYVINVLRLASLGIIGAFTSAETFAFFHEIVWQGIYIVFVVAVWLLWMEVIVRERKDKTEQAA